MRHIHPSTPPSNARISKSKSTTSHFTRTVSPVWVWCPCPSRPPPPQKFSCSARPYVFLVLRLDEGPGRLHPHLAFASTRLSLLFHDLLYGKDQPPTLLLQQTPPQQCRLPVLGPTSYSLFYSLLALKKVGPNGGLFGPGIAADELPAKLPIRFSLSN